MNRVFCTRSVAAGAAAEAAQGGAGKLACAADDAESDRAVPAALLQPAAPVQVSPGLAELDRNVKMSALIFKQLTRFGGHKLFNACHSCLIGLFVCSQKPRPAPPICELQG